MLESIPPIQLTCIKLFFSALFFLPMIRKAHSQIRKVSFMPIVLISIFVIAIPQLAYHLAIVEVSPSVVFLIQILIPVSALISGYFFFNKEFNTIELFGVIMATIGVIIMIGWGSVSELTGNVTYILLYLVCVIPVGFVMYTVRRKLRNVSISSITGYCLYFLSVPSLIGIFFTGLPDTVMANYHAKIGLGIGIVSGIVVLGLGYFLLFTIARNAGIMFASSVYFLKHIVYFLLATMDLHLTEKINWQFIIGSILIIIGSILINRVLIQTERSKRRKANQFFYKKA